MNRLSIYIKKIHFLYSNVLTICGLSGKFYLRVRLGSVEEKFIPFLACYNWGELNNFSKPNHAVYI